MKKVIVFCLFLIGLTFLQAQNDTIELGEISISDAYLLRHTETQSKILLSDSLTDRNSPLLTTLLNYNTPIYFKENGLGMVSSPSFRGTTASQTAVIWNGININSQFNGQSDFNTLTSDGFSNIAIMPGGSGIGYGTGAIGGSIHLNSNLRFNRGFENKLRLSYGSFETRHLSLNSGYSNEKISLKVNLNRNDSDNDYKFPDTDIKNKNGEYYHQGLSLSAAYKLNSKNRLIFHSALTESDRHFSLTTPNATPTKYNDYHTRSLLEWESRFGKVSSSLKIAFLEERFKYYPNLNSDLHTFGELNDLILKYDAGIPVNELIFLNSVLEYSRSKGKGSEILPSVRELGSVGLIWKHKLSNNFIYEAGIRQEINDFHKPPFLYSLGIKWKASDFYSLYFNSSKNFRMPTFNDLYWPGSGDLNLKPETSIQAELGNEFEYKGISLRLNAYYNSVTDMLRWVPKQGDLWMPVNTDEVEIYGLEALMGVGRNYGKHHFRLDATYAYTVSKDKKTGMQLIYVPYHKGTGVLGYTFEGFSAFYRILITGEVFTDTKNQIPLKSYTVSDTGLEYSFGKKRNLSLGISVLNLWNSNYQNVANRIMPGRNYHINLIYKL